MWLEDPSDGNLGWFGGCGNLHCTGAENILITDMDGSFFADLNDEYDIEAGSPS
jgi:hypothetical protein